MKKKIYALLLAYLGITAGAWADEGTTFTGNAQFSAWNSSEAENPTLRLDMNANVLTVTRADGVIDLNGHTVGTFYLQNDVEGKTLTLRNGTVSGEIDGRGGWHDFYKGTVVLENITANREVFTDGHAYVFKGGYYNESIENYTKSGYPGTVIIYDGHFKDIFNGNGVYHNGSSSGTYTIYGGKFANVPSSIVNVTIPEGYSVMSNTEDDKATYPYIVTEVENDTFLITTAQDLKDFAAGVNNGTIATTANARLTADIDLAGSEENKWMPIGTSERNYNGTFDGQGYTVKNIYCRQQTEGVGLIGWAGSIACIKNVRVEGFIDNSTDGAGTGNSATQTLAGGIIGVSKGAKVLNCSFAGNIYSFSDVGGIVGAGHATIVNCYNEGTITFHSSTNQAGGGIVGNRGTVINCYNAGSVINNGSSTFAIDAIGYNASETNGYFRQKCVKNGSSAIWTNTSKGTAMSEADMKAPAFVTTLNTNVAALKTTYPDIVEWSFNADGYPVHANRKMQYAMPSSGVGSFSLAWKCKVPEGVEAYICKTYDAVTGTISVEKIEGGVVPAATGVLLRGTGDATYVLTVTAEEAGSVDGNQLVAVTKATHVDAVSGEYTNFGLSGGKFVKIAANESGEKIPANRAYLPILTSALPTNASQAKQLTIRWDDGNTTAIQVIEKNVEKSGNWYDLYGRRIAKKPTQKGVYILDGQKVLVK